MNQQASRALLAVLGIAVGAPVLMQTVPSLTWFPEWLGGAVALAALFGVFMVLWHAGALRIRYVVLFGIALGVAAVVGRLLELA